MALVVTGRVVRSILAVSVVGAVHSVRRNRSARFAGVRLPGSAAAQALTIGSPLSAPPVMLLALVVAARRNQTRVVGVLASMMIVGILGEVDTWTTLRRPRADPLGAACVALEIGLPSALLFMRFSSPALLVRGG